MPPYILLCEGIVLFSFCIVLIIKLIIEYKIDKYVNNNNNHQFTMIVNQCIEKGEVMSINYNNIIINQLFIYSHASHIHLYYIH